MLTSRGLGRVLGDLAEMGFDARWGVLGAHHVGAPHKRERIWIVADAVKDRRELVGVTPRRVQQGSFFRELVGAIDNASQLEAYGCIRGKTDGLAEDVDRLAALGNGQVPRVVSTAWSILNER